MIWWANSIHSAFFVVRTSLQRFHTVLTNQHNQRTRDTYTLTRIRRCDCTNTTQPTLFFFERQQYPASANHEQSLFAMLLYPSTSLNLVYSWLVYLRSKLSKPSVFLKLFSFAENCFERVAKLCENLPNAPNWKTENIFSLCRTVVKEEISVTKTKPILNEQNERISASVTVSTYIRRRTH